MNDSKKKPKPNVETLGFEEALKELEDIVEQLESGSVNLDEAIDAYSRAMTLKQHCKARLEEARLKVEQIKMPEGEGTPTVQSFETDD